MPDGIQTAGNGGEGVLIQSAQHNKIGDAGKENVIASNTLSGIRIDGGKNTHKYGTQPKGNLTTAFLSQEKLLKTE